MKVFITEINSISNQGDTIIWLGPEIIAKTWEDAELLVKLYHPYCKIVGQKVLTLDFFTGEEVEYQQNNLN